MRLIAGHFFSPHVVITTHTRIDGSTNWFTVPPAFSIISIVSVPGTLKNFRMRLFNIVGSPTAAPTGGTFTFTVRKNEVDTDLEVVIGDTSPDGQDLSSEITFAAGDTVDIKCVPFNLGGAARYPLWSFEFEADTNTESIYFCNGGPWYKNIPTGFFPLVPDASNPFDNTESEVQQIVAAPGKFKSLFLKLSNNPGSGGEAYKMTLRVNGADTALTVTISGASTSGNDLSNEVTVAAGDLVCWKKTAISTPQNNVSVRAGFAFVADKPNQSLFINGFKIALDTSSNRYHSLSHRLEVWNADEYKVRQLGQPLSIKHFYVRVSNAPGVGKSWTFRVRKNDADTKLAVTISGTDTTGNDTTHILSVKDDDYLDIVSEPSGTPAAAAAYWGLVNTLLTILPSGPTTRITGLIHRYWPGHFRLECILGGGLSGDFASGGRVELRPPLFWPGLQIKPGIEPIPPFPRLPELPIPDDEVEPGGPKPGGPGRPDPEGPKIPSPPERPSPGGPRGPDLPDIPLPGV